MRFLAPPSNGDFCTSHVMLWLMTDCKSAFQAQFLQGLTEEDGEEEGNPEELSSSGISSQLEQESEQSSGGDE